jgi:hypothetical protein
LFGYALAGFSDSIAALVSPLLAPTFQKKEKCEAELLITRLSNRSTSLFLLLAPSFCQPFSFVDTFDAPYQGRWAEHKNYSK